MNGGAAGGTETGGESGTGTGGTGEGSTIVPSPGPVAPVPGSVTPVPGTSPSPSPSATGTSAASGETQAAAQLQSAPVTFSLPGGYGGSAGQSFTLGQGRLAKPPFTATFSVSQGYDTNVFNADSHPVATPTPVPAPTPPLQSRIIAFNIAPPLRPIPIFQFFRSKVAATPTPAKPVGVIASPVSSVTLAVQVQKGTPRTVFTMDLSVGAMDYWDEPGSGVNYNGSFDLAMVHRLTPRATLSVEASAVYQNTPDFALVNNPTNNNSGGDYLNGTLKADLTYAWSNRISTVTSYALNANLLESNASSNVYVTTYGTQFRYTVSARNTITAEVRASDSAYPTNAGANNSSFYYLFGLNTNFSSRFTNSVSGGLQETSYPSGPSQIQPYMESATTLGLPHQGSLTWTNEYGDQNSGNAGQTTTSYRTGLTMSQPLSTKLVASLSLSYNYVLTKDSTNAAGSSTQNELQGTLSLGYNLSPKLSLSLSYSLTDLLTTQLNSSYDRDQIFLGGTYSFQ
jgi:hypothetical protein